ncbi:MAG: hypothetical protein Kow0042_00920 [Calditrichia bacterium]
MKRSVFPIVMAMLLLVFARASSSPRDGISQTITAEQIQSSGIIRLSDIFSLAEDLRVSTTAGFHWEISLNGLFPFQKQNWIVMLDGQRINLDLLSTKSINMLPISVDLLDSVKIICAPQIHDGEFTEAGLIHFYTSPPKSGFSLRGRNTIGNETGDPGPYMFTPYRSPNVDRLGPDYSFSMDYGNTRWNTRLGLSFQNHYSTDPAILKRNPGLEGQYTRGQMVSPYLKLGFKVGSSENEITLSHSTSKRLPFLERFGSDLLFLEPFAREIPTHSSLSFVGISGQLKSAGRFGIGYRSSFSALMLDKPDQTAYPALDWEMRTWNSRVEIHTRNSAFQNIWGLGLNYHDLNTQYDLKSPHDLSGQLYWQNRFRISPKVLQNSGLWMNIHGDGVGIKTFVSHQWQVKSRSVLWSNLSYSQRLFSEDNNLWYWSSRGYDFIGQNGVKFFPAAPTHKRILFSLDLGWYSDLNQWITLDVAAALRSFRHDYFDGEDFQFTYYRYSLSPEISLEAGQGGTIVLGKGGIYLRWPEVLSQRVSYTYIGRIGGSRLFRQAWESVPAQGILYQITFTPVENFSIFSLIHYRGKSYWPAYRNLEAQTNGEYSPTVNGFFDWRLVMNKWFWKRRLWARVVFRNIFNQPERYHPFGAVMNLRWHIHIGFSLESFAG